MNRCKRLKFKQRIAQRHNQPPHKKDQLQTIVQILEIPQWSSTCMNHCTRLKFKQRIAQRHNQRIFLMKKISYRRSSKSKKHPNDPLRTYITVHDQDSHGGLPGDPTNVSSSRKRSLTKATPHTSLFKAARSRFARSSARSLEFAKKITNTRSSKASGWTSNNLLASTVPFKRRNP